jgi:hypothetical protein
MTWLPWILDRSIVWPQIFASLKFLSFKNFSISEYIPGIFMHNNECLFMSPFPKTEQFRYGL